MVGPAQGGIKMNIRTLVPLSFWAIILLVGLGYMWFGIPGIVIVVVLAFLGTR